MDGGEELAVLQREIEEEVEEEREQYVSELPEREALYHTQLAEWKALRKMRVRTREGGREGGYQLHVYMWLSERLFGR